MLRSLTGLLWVSPEDAARAELIKSYDAYLQMATAVAVKREAWELAQLNHSAAKKDHQATAAIYEAAISTKEKNSKVINDLRISFESDGERVQARWADMARARKDLDAAIAVMVTKHKEYLAADVKFQRLVRPTASLENTSSESTLAPVKAAPKHDLNQELHTLHEQAKVDPNSALTATGKVRIPENLLQHFNGNNREHVSTAQTQATRREASTTHASINFANIHAQLAKTMRAPSTPVAPKVNLWKELPFDGVDSEAASDLWKELPFAQPNHAVEHLFCLKFQGTQEMGLKPELDAHLKQTLLARRSLFRD
jgi:hypothetical protein